MEERVEKLICRVGAPRRRFRRQETEWDLVETVLGLRLPTDFKALSDHCRELWAGRLEGELLNNNISSHMWVNL